MAVGRGRAKESTGSLFPSCLRNSFPVCLLCSMAAWDIEVNSVLCAVESSPLLKVTTLPTHILTRLPFRQEERRVNRTVVLAHLGVQIFVRALYLFI